jgi:hypothetical protein
VLFLTVGRLSRTPHDYRKNTLIVASQAGISGADAKIALEATVSAFLIVGFSVPNAQTYDELDGNSSCVPKRYG